MKSILLSLLLLWVSCIAFAQYPVVSISDIQFVTQAATGNCDDQTTYLGDTVIIRAKVVADGYESVPSGIASAATGHKNFWLQEGNGGPFSGIDIFSLSGSSVSEDIHNLLAGDSVEVVGVIDDYNGETELIPLEGNSITLLSQNLDITPAVAEIADLNDADRNNLLQTGEQWEGVYVEFHNVTVASVDFFSGGSRVSFNVEDQFGNLINVSDRYRVQKLPGEGGTFVAPNVGDQVDTLRGIILHSKNNCAGFSGRGYELHPFSESDYVYGASAPRIFNITRTPTVPSSTDDVTINADITDNDGNVVSATLYYATGTTGAFTSTAMTLASGETYEADIPAQSDGTLVRWYLVAEDDSGLVTTLPNSNPATLTYLYRVRDNGLTIYDLQYTPYSAGTSPYVGESVSVEGVVTAGVNSTDTGDLGSVYIQQENQLSYAGIWLMQGTNLTSLNRGDKVSVEGVVAENFGMTALTDIASVSVTGSGTISPTVLNPDSFSIYNAASHEQYEGMLIKFEHPTAGEDLYLVEQNADAQTGNNYAEYRVGTDEFNPSSGTRIIAGRNGANSSLYVSYVNDSLWEVSSGIMNVPANVVHYGEYMESISGIMYYSFGDMKLFPRNNNDIVNYGGGPVYASAYPAEDTVCLGETVQFVNNSSAVADQFDWTYSDGGTASIKYPMYAITTPGMHSITMTATNTVDGENDQTILTDAVFIDTSANCGLGVFNHKVEFAAVYPNPAHDFIYVESSNISGSMMVSMFDLSGKKVISTTSYIRRSKVDLSELQSGLYLIEVRNNEGALIATQKVVKD
ncbi:MAG TPA: hypothetical protein DCX14_10345 [Flavobacteriales bacterium]|nr:hypothetical protein [Flavobacteriales bacterium]